jgi:hypothetical protein
VCLFSIIFGLWCFVQIISGYWLTGTLLWINHFKTIFFFIQFTKSFSFFFIKSSTGLANPQNQNDDYQSDYGEEYNDDDEPGPSLSTPDPPTVEVTEYKETVKEGDNVILHCDVKNVGGK